MTLGRVMHTFLEIRPIRTQEEFNKLLDLQRERKICIPGPLYRKLQYVQELSVGNACSVSFVSKCTTEIDYQSKM